MPKRNHGKNANNTSWFRNRCGGRRNYGQDSQSSASNEHTKPNVAKLLSYRHVPYHDSQLHRRPHAKQPAVYIADLGCPSCSVVFLKEGCISSTFANVVPSRLFLVLSGSWIRLHALDHDLNASSDQLLGLGARVSSNKLKLRYTCSGQSVCVCFNNNRLGKC